MNYMSDLISRQAVERETKDFNKRRADRLPKISNIEEYREALDNLLEENVEMLKAIRDIPTAYDVEKVVQQLEEEKTSIDATCNYGYRIGIAKAIEIVRNGGKE